jgi:drug/metabolite transporter (DMT)-like permease
MLYIGIIAALAHAACFALGGVVQQKEASTASEKKSLSFTLLLDLARDKVWLAGIGSTAGAFGFKALALAFAPLSIVQPLVVTELLFAIPVSIRRHHLRMGPREWAGILAVAGGLALGIIAASPTQGNPLPPLPRWGEMFAGVAALLAVALLIGRRLSGPVRASMFALAAVSLLATQSALLAAVDALFEQGIVTALTAWQPYAMGAVSIVGLMLVQSAYQAGPLAASMPVMDTVNPCISIAIGVAVLGESIDTGTWHLTGAAAGLALLIGGVIVIDTSPLVRRVQRVENQQQADAEAGTAQGGQ